jgi:hypothetical protein
LNNHRLVCSCKTKKKQKTTKKPICVTFLILLDVLLPLCIPCAARLLSTTIGGRSRSPFFFRTTTTTSTPTQTSTTTTSIYRFYHYPNLVHDRWRSTRATTNPFVPRKIKQIVHKKKIRTTGGLLKLRRIPGIGDNDEGASMGPDAAPQPSASHDPSSIGEGRSRSAQRWMKLRTTVQLTSAISSTVAQSKKTSLKREDSFIARFSTRQIPEAQVN